MAIFWVFFFLSAGMYPCLKYFRALVRRLRADKPSTLPMALQRTFSWTQTPSAPLKLAMTWTASKKLPMVVAVVRSKVGYDGRLIAGRNVETRIVKRDAEGCGRMKWMSSEPFNRLCRVGWSNAERRLFRRSFAWGVRMRMWTSNANIKCKRQMRTLNADADAVSQNRCTPLLLLLSLTITTADPRALLQRKQGPRALEAMKYRINLTAPVPWQYSNSRTLTTVC